MNSDFNWLLKQVANMLVLSLIVLFSIVVSIKKYDWITFQYVLILFQSLLSLFFLTSRISVCSMYFIFSLVFFGFTPFLAYQSDIIYWTDKGFDDEYRTLVNLLIIIFNSVFLFLFRVKVANRFVDGDYDKVTPYYMKSKVMILLVLLCSIILKLKSIDFNFIYLFVRTGGDLDLTFERFSPTNIITNTVAIFVPFLIYFMNKYSLNKSKLISFFSIGVIIINVFPTANTRFIIALIYLPLFIANFSFFRQSMSFLWLFLLSFFTIFPFLDKFRSFTLGTKLDFSLSFDFLTKGHFDSYQSLLRVVSEGIVTYGYQLLSNVLFFVPRVFWPEKGTGSGYLMAHYLDYNFPNISMNFFGEGYINFGWMGILLYAFLLVKFLLYIDLRFFTNPNRTLSDSINHLFFIGIMVIIMRGDFMTAYSMVFSAFIVFIFLKASCIAKS